jgi:hypothetical protein
LNDRKSKTNRGQASSICVGKTKFSEDVKSSGRVLLGDVNLENNKLWPELKDETDFFALLSPADFF